jgi:hypothetical protein
MISIFLYKTIIRDESAKELSVLLACNQLKRYTREGGKRKQRKNFRKRSTKILADPDRDRMQIDAKEILNLQLPSLIKILKVNQPELGILMLGGIGCIITGVIMPVFAFFYSQMFIVSNE